VKAFAVLATLSIGCSSGASQSLAPDVGETVDSSTDTFVETSIEASSDAITDASVETALPACPTFADGVSGGTVQSSALVEVSGIAASRRNEGVLWVHNDSGSIPEVYALDATGKHLGVFGLTGAKPGDYEDIAVGPGPDASLTYVYVGDIGDNAVTRATVRVFRFAEPAIPTGGAPLSSTVAVDTLTITYPDGPHNAEALLLDPLTRDLLIVTKNGGLASVFRVSGTFAPGATVTAEPIAKIDAGVVSSGDISPDGREIVVKTDSAGGKLFRRPEGVSLAAAFATPPCAIKVKTEVNGEALGFAADGSGYYTTSETAHQPIWFFERLP